MIPLNAEQYAEMDAAIVKLASTVVPLFVERNDTAVVHGSGTLFAIGETKFIVTAAHVLKQARDANVVLRFAGVKDGNHVLGRANGMAIWHDDRTGSHRPDVAFWRLSAEEASYFRERTYLRLENIDRPPFSNDSFYSVVGFPTSMTEPLKRYVEAKNTIEAMKLYTRRYDGPSDNLEGYDPDIHMLTHGRSNALEAEQGNTKPFPERLHGVSGGQIWRISCDDVNGRMEIEAALHAIQTSVYRKGAIIRGTRWLHVLSLVFNAWPELRSATGLWVPNSRIRRNAAEM